MSHRATALTISAIGAGVALCLSAAAILDRQPWPGIGRKYLDPDAIRESRETQRGRDEARADLSVGRLRYFTSGGPSGLDTYAGFVRSRYGVELVVRPGCFPSFEHAAHDDGYNEIVSRELAQRFGSGWQGHFMQAFQRAQPQADATDPCPTPLPAPAQVVPAE